ncbi:MAG: hypothetical protein BWY87_00315 [Deltaproteobacteria bacterium ADurb.Bin510]|nr:MAG: hypothetical protein BWY87_00315 [Deltaproteobacteria bacterium ADurb.Bin510]
MKITDASLAMAASHTYSESYEKRENLQVSVQTPAADTVELASESCPEACGSVGLLDDESERLLKGSLKALLVEILTGHKIKFLDPAEFEQQGSAQLAGGAVDASASQRQGWGISYDYSTTYTETEQLDVAAAGTIRTADGREFSFEMELSMSRSFVEHNSLSLRLGDAALSDPLVLNLSGQAASLGGFSFAFDFDGDGSADSLPGLNAGSAYLAIDRDGDGSIGSGSELFGPTSGNGWNELTAYDQDGNGWIDESDEVFSRLRLWQPQAGGGANLSSLAQQGVGAIWLKSVTQPFDLRDQGNALVGRVLSTGLFVGEDGRSGSVQQLDLLV